MDKKRIMVAMSGGVDSSVSAALLLQQGHEVQGMTMRVWDGPVDVAVDARRVDNMTIDPASSAYPFIWSICARNFSSEW